jgi:isopenicillin-N epimerase
LIALARPLLPRWEWVLDPNITFLNHGSFGGVPRALLSAQRRLQQRMERNPTKFLLYELGSVLRGAATRLADFVGGSGMDYVFVENATAGCNTVLGSVGFSPGDEILITDHCYPAVHNAAEFIASRTGAKVIEAKVPFPLMDSAEIVAAVEKRLGSRTRLVILDHVTSPTAVVFPVHELTSLCHKAGAKVLIDGAHAPGMLSLNVPSIDADWYVGNCHKWLMAPKGSGFLWMSPVRRNEIHPLVISHYYKKGVVDEFDWVGTRDPTPWLCVPAAIELHQRMGGPGLRERNAILARKAAVLLARAWKTAQGSASDLIGSMATVQLPIREVSNSHHAHSLRTLLLTKYRIDVAITAFNGILWARISAHAYNSFEDYERLADAIPKAILN